MQRQPPASLDQFAVADTIAAQPPPVAVGPALADASRTVQRTVLPRPTVIDSQRTLVVEERHRYERDRILGEGGIGLVHRARDNDIDRPVAVKKLRAEQRDPASLARFVDEIRLVGQLEHPNIVPIHDVGVDEEGEYYFVMKYVEGETLEQVIERLAAGDPDYHRRFPFARRVEIFLGILEALRYAHGRKILHRDIKPANVMLGSDGEVLVMDWGIACRTDDPSAREGEFVGTPLYMSPEQAACKPVDERSDIYSLCVLFHEFLGLRHYLADRRNTTAVIVGVTTEEVPSASSVPSPHQPPAPWDLSWFLKAGLDKDPAKRFPSVEAMIERLRRRAQGKIPVQCPVTLVKRATNEWLRFVDRHPNLIVASMALVALALVAGAVFAVVRALR